MDICRYWNSWIDTPHHNFSLIFSFYLRCMFQKFLELYFSSLLSNCLILEIIFLITNHSFMYCHFYIACFIYIGCLIFWINLHVLHKVFNFIVSLFGAVGFPQVSGYSWFSTLINKELGWLKLMLEYGYSLLFGGSIFLYLLH